tara:strand:- start:635 stop:1561 length:927 start_codon:yes stop_codon:yes gene_type:complete
MDKYTYWNYGKTGSWEIMCNFFYNKKKTVMFHAYHPVISTLYRPAGEYYIKQWYYQQDNKLKTWYAVKDFSTYDKIINDCFPMSADMDLPHQWFWESPFKTSRGDYNMKFWGGRRHNKGQNKIDEKLTSFYNCMDEVLDHDLINYPNVLLGYVGNIGVEDNILYDLENLSPSQPTQNIERILESLRSRVNIVPYKEDIESLVKKALIGFVGDAQWMKGKDFYIQECVRKLKIHKKTFPLLCRMLEYNRIPYKVFNLDRDNYADYFNLDRWLPIRGGLAEDHDLHLHNTMTSKRQKHLPKLIDQVLCSL